MAYQGRLDIDVSFHSHTDLDAALTEAGAPQGTRQLDGGRRSGWPILAQLGEYAHADLDGLHLTGWTRGHLLHQHSQTLAALAHHADGTIHGIGEDGYRWVTTLQDGTVANQRDWADTPEQPTVARADWESRADDRNAEGRTARIELQVTHGLPRIAAIPWIADHIEELQPRGPQAGSITLTGLTTLDTEALQEAAPTAAWQAFCNADTATPGRWIGHHSATGTVEAHHLEGQIVVPRRSTRAGRPGAPDASDHLARLMEILELLDTPNGRATAATAIPTSPRASDPLAEVALGSPALVSQAGTVPVDSSITPAR